VVPVIDLSRRGARWAVEFGERAAAVAAGGNYLLGPELFGFESEFAAAVGAEHAVAVASGAAALQLAVTAAGVGPGDEVLVPAFTAVPTCSAVVAAGAHPIVVDVDADTACVTADLLDRARTPATRAAIVVHLYGLPVPVPVLDGVVAIEDAAQAAGALCSASRSAMTAYSFYPTKNLGGIGDGGAVVTDDRDLAAIVRTLRVHGMTEQYVHTAVSQNFRMSELEAVWLRLGLPSLADDVAARRRIARSYREAAPHLWWQADHDDHAYHLCVFRTSDRDATRSRLAAAGVATAVHYPLALTQQPAYRHYGWPACPAAEAWAAECVTVPCFPEMTDAEIDQVASALADLPGANR
jgi:dTDP-4-amino-4,6-dideoxygalactose transaminase